MTPLASGLLLLAIALVIAGYVVACDHFDQGPHDGPWSLGAVLLAGLSLAPSLVDAHASIDPAQAGGACVQAARVAASADAGQRGDGSLPGPRNAPTLRAGQRETRVWQGAPGRLPLAPDAFWRHVAPTAAGPQSRSVGPAVGGAPWGVAAAPRSMAASAATVAPRESAAAQGVGPGLPWLASRVAAGRTKGQGAESPALTSAPAGVPGGFGSRGAALLDAGPAKRREPLGARATIAGRHLGRGASVQERGEGMR